MTTEDSLNNPNIVEAEHFNLFVSGVTDYAIYMLSPAGIVSSWNAGAQRFKGYAASEIIGKHFSTFYTEADIATGLPTRALATAVSEGRFEDEGLRVRKDGSHFWAHVVLDPIRDESGCHIGFTKITRDVTDRREAAEALRRSEEQFRLLVQGVTDYAIYMLSPEGFITNWNAGAERIKGFTANDVIGTHFSRFYGEDERLDGLPMKALAAASDSGGFESEGWRTRKDGSTFWAHVVIDPIRNDAGELLGFAKITRDVTERREAALTLEKTKEALFRSQKIESLGRLTGGVAHDFNNLLSVISNGIILLRMSKLSAIDSKTLDSMERATTRGAALTQQLLSFSRQQPLKQEKHDVNRIITSFEPVLRRALKSSVRFTLKLAPSLPAVMIDAAQFEAALLNLVVNCRDAVGDTGSVTVRSRLKALPESSVPGLAAGWYVQICVADTGVGIPNEILDRVIEPFFTTKPLGKGTGLGLSQVYGLAKQSQGGIKIESDVESGTTVNLYFPPIDVEDFSETRLRKNDLALVVDDQPDVLEMAAELFRTLGFDVITASNGAVALDLINQNPAISILFSDVVMPGISGPELARAAKMILPTLKVILASGYVSQAFEDRGIDANEFPLIAKPYSIADIVQHLRI